jgi:hypothetical protein
MGRAADNERIKLRATYWNNGSIALAVGGVILPYVALAPKALEVGRWAKDWREGKPVPELDILPTIMTIGLMTILFIFAKRLRRRADREIQKVQGD